MHECNLLVATSVLEEGIDVPKCNLVVRFDVPQGYRSYVQSKGRAKAQDAYYMLMIEEDKSDPFIEELAKYHSIEQVNNLSVNCKAILYYFTLRFKNMSRNI